MKNYQAKTLEEIIEQAAEDYGCDTSSLMYNVLEEKDGRSEEHTSELQSQR